MCTFIVVSKCCKSFNMFSYIQGEKIRTGKLWMKCVTPEQMKARAGKITFCGKHKHHSKTLREIQRPQQGENALKISRGTHLCFNVNLFFFWRKYPACYCALPEEKSTYILTNVHVYFSLQMI